MVAGEGGMRDYIKKCIKLEKMEIFHYLCALNSKKSGDTDIASIVKC